MQGCKIHASVRRNLVYKFQPMLTEGRVYQILYFSVGYNVGDFRTTSHQFKINFHNHTTVKEIRNTPITKSPYSLMPLCEIMFNEPDSSYLIGKFFIDFSVSSMLLKCEICLWYLFFRCHKILMEFLLDLAVYKSSRRMRKFVRELRSSLIKMCIIFLAMLNIPNSYIAFPLKLQGLSWMPFLW